MLLANPEIGQKQPFLSHQLENLLLKQGWVSVYVWYKQILDKLHDRDQQLVFQNGRFFFQSAHLIEKRFLEDIFRRRYLLHKYSKLWKQLVLPLKKGNQTDLLLDNLPKNVHQVNQNQTIFSFSGNDIVHIIKEALLQHDECVPMPVKPRNPYTNQVFHTLELKSMYDYLVCLGKNIPKVVNLFRWCSCDIDLFQQKHGAFLKQQACLSYVLEMSVSEKNTFILDFIYGCDAHFCSQDMKLRYIHFNVVSTYIKHFFLDTATIFRDYLYYFHYKKKSYHRLASSKSQLVFHYLEECWKKFNVEKES